MASQPGAMLNTVAFGNRPENVEVPFIGSRAPTSTDVNFPIGKRWIFEGEYVLLSLSTAGGVRSASWAQTTSSGGDVVAVLGTANQVTVVTAAGTATVSLPSAITAPGSLTTTTTLAAGTTVTAGTGIVATTGNIVASTGNITSTLGSVAAATTVTAGTTVTATLGNITATNGNFVGSTAGTGLLFNSPTATGAAASPIVLNGRSGAAVFTSVSIAAAADLTLTITNSEITAATTQVIYSLSGVTTGAALSIKSVTNSSGSSAVVVTNGTGATTSTADITLTFLVLNT